MFSKIQTMKSTKSYSDKIKQLKNAFSEADAVIIGAGSGLSTAAGLSYSGERFEKYFKDFADKYGIRDIYSGGFYPFPDEETYWAWWSRHIWWNRYEAEINSIYTDLLELVKDKDYFVLTTNVDHRFQLSGFDKKRLFYTQGDYGLLQCSKPCCQATYDNKELVEQMMAEQKNMRIPTELIPRCPMCGAPMTTNLRADDKFVEDEGWHKAAERYSLFLKRHENLRILFLELGVGYNTPVIIKYPFWKMTAKNPKATYCCINYGEAVCPDEITPQSICFNDDIGMILSQIKELKVYLSAEAS